MAIITTTKGELDEALLRRVDGAMDTDREHTTWVEYWLDGELVHRSVHVTIKDGMEAASVVESLLHGE